MRTKQMSESDLLVSGYGMLDNVCSPAANFSTVCYKHHYSMTLKSCVLVDTIHGLESRHHVRVPYSNVAIV